MLLWSEQQSDWIIKTHQFHFVFPFLDYGIHVKRLTAVSPESDFLFCLQSFSKYESKFIFWFWRKLYLSNAAPCWKKRMESSASLSDCNGFTGNIRYQHLIIQIIIHAPIYTEINKNSLSLSWLSQPVMSCFVYNKGQLDIFSQYIRS